MAYALRPVDVVFDSFDSDNGSLDTPLFNLLPEVADVVGIALVWVNIP